MADRLISYGLQTDDGQTYDIIPPVPTETERGGIKAKAKTDNDTIEVKIGTDGKAYVPKTDTELSTSSTNAIQNQAVTTKINELTSRMNTFTSLEEGSTTGDAELQDIRVGTDGTVYDNAGEAVRSQINQLSEEMANTGSGMTATVKNAFLECFANVAWATAKGQACYDKLKTALNESVGEIKLSSITATCSETAQIGTAAIDLDIVVTAVYSDGSSAQVTGWTTSGTVVEGTNTFVVSYGGKNTTVTVTGVDLYYVLDNVTNKSVNMASDSYSDGGETVAGFPNTFQPRHFFGSKAVEQDTAVKIKYIPSATNYNGMFAYCVNPETFTTTQKNTMRLSL